MQHQQVTGAQHEIGDRLEIPKDVVRQRRVGVRIDDERCGDVQQRVSVRRCLGHDVGADDAIRAAAIVEHERLAELRADFVGDAARDDIGGTACGEGDDQADGAGGVSLCLNRSDR